MTFPKALAQCEMQITSINIRTRVAVSIFNDDNSFARNASYMYVYIDV